MTTAISEDGHSSRARKPAAVLDSRTSSAASSAIAPNGLRAFTDLTREHGFEPLVVEGALPAELGGTLYRNGPSLFSAGGQRYGHWFDGDGAITAVRFASGQAHGAVRVVETEGLLAERRAGRALYAGYGTASPRGLLRRVVTSKKRGLERFNDGKNAANTSVLFAGGKLLALWEGGLPTELSTTDLRTLGETTLDGAVRQTFSAHPRRVPARGATYNFGVRYGKDTFVDLYEQKGGTAWKLLGDVKLGGASMIHDFVATERHLVLFVAPLRLRALRAMFGIGAYSDNLVWRGELATEIIVVPIDDPTRAIRIEAPASFQWHYGNAFERGDTIVVDMVTYPDFASNAYFGSLASGKVAGEANGRLARATLDLRARRATVEEPFRDAWAGTCEFPTVDPRRAAGEHRYVYAAGHASPSASRADVQDRLLRFDMSTGRASAVTLGAGQYPGEPLFVPRPGSVEEDDGWLLTLVYDALAHKSHVAVLDGRRFDEGPIARAHFDHHIPFSFHGTWA